MQINSPTKTPLMSTRNTIVMSKTRSEVFTKHFSFKDLISFMNNEESVLKFDSNQEIVKLYSLHKLATNVLKETGNWPLFFSRYFFQTKLSNGKTIFAPLLLKRLKQW